MADYFDIHNVDIEAPCEWGETASVECDITNEDSYDHLIWIVIRWRRSGSADAWNTIFDNTDIIDAGDTKHVSTSLVMPNFDVEVGFITYHYDGGWTPDDYELQHQPYLTEPTVTTQAASGIAATSAYLNGYTQYKHDYIGFKWRVKGTGIWTYDWNSNGDSGGTGAWSHLITGLDPNETYEFYAYATNDDGTGNGSVLEFTTVGGIPVALTKDATGVDNNSAFLVGQIDDKNYGAVDHYGFDYGLTDSYGTRVWVDEFPVYEDTDYSKLISSLVACTTYHFRAVVHTEYGYGYGADNTFITTGSVPTVWSKNATGIADIDAYLVGQLLNDQDGTVDEYGFDYGLTDSYGYEATQSGSVPEGIDFMEHITSLNDDTTYHYRTKVHTACGWGYGADKTFTTMPSTPLEDPKGYIWVDENDNCIHYISATEVHYVLNGFTKGDYVGSPGAPCESSGYIWVEGTQLHYIAADCYEWYGEGAIGDASGADPGYIWIEGEQLHYIDASGNERYFGL